MFNTYNVTTQFENILAAYTGAKYAVAIDNCSNALFLALKYINIVGQEIAIPAHTYPSVPCTIIHAGGRPKFIASSNVLKGAYQLGDTGVWDSALRFTTNMYISNSFMCLSFSGPKKILKLGKGGAILTDNLNAVNWFKKARYSGRNECAYLDDDFDMLGWNFYMLPEIACRGIMLMQQFMPNENTRLINDDVAIEYPDLSKFRVYQQ